MTADLCRCTFLSLFLSTDCLKQITLPLCWSGSILWSPLSFDVSLGLCKFSMNGSRYCFGLPKGCFTEEKQIKNYVRNVVKTYETAIFLSIFCHIFFLIKFLSVKKKKKIKVAFYCKSRPKKNLTTQWNQLSISLTQISHCKNLLKHS